MRSQDESDGPIRVLTWNLYLRPRIISALLDLPKLPGRRRRIRGILRIIDRGKYDILCLQEAFLRATRRALLRRYPYYYRKLTHRFSLRLHSGLMLLTRFPILHRSGMIFRGRLAGGRIADGWVDKGVMHAEVEMPDGPLHVFTTHLQAERYPKVRRAQLIQAASFIQEYKGRAIFAGDFNLDREEMELLKPLLDLGFTDAWTKSNPGEEGGTWPETGERYDLVLHRDVPIKSVDLLPTRWSDHYGVVATL